MFFNDSTDENKERTSELVDKAKNDPKEVIENLKELKSFLFDDNKEVRAESAYIFGLLSKEHSEEVIPYIEDISLLLIDSFDKARGNAAFSLNYLAMKHPEDVSNYKKDIALLFEDDFKKARENATYTLGTIARQKPEEVKEFTENISELLNEEYVGTKTGVIRFLKNISKKFPEHIRKYKEEIEKLKEHNDEEIKELAEKTIKNIKENEAQEELTPKKTHSDQKTNEFYIKTQELILKPCIYTYYQTYRKWWSKIKNKTKMSDKDKEASKITDPRKEILKAFEDTIYLAVFGYEIVNNTKEKLENLKFELILTDEKGEGIKKAQYWSRETQDIKNLQKQFQDHQKITLEPDSKIKSKEKTDPIKTPFFTFELTKKEYNKIKEKFNIKFIIKKENEIIKEKRVSTQKDKEAIEKEHQKIKDKLQKEINLITLDTSKENENKSKSGCFIATAVYGTPKAKELKILRNFRDQILLKNRLGRAFTKTYYKLSPPIANLISKSIMLRKFFAYTLVHPLYVLIKKIYDFKEQEN